MQPHDHAARLHSIRLQLQHFQPRARHGVLPFGDPRIDDCLTEGGLALGGLHEIEGAGLEAELGAVAAGFLACLLARMGEARPAGPSPGKPIFWIARACDLHAPGLLAHGLDPGRLILVQAPDDTQVLASMEAVLRTGTAAAVVGEVGRLDRLAARRLHLACLGRGSTGFVLRRWLHGRKAVQPQGNAALTSWRVAAVPSEAAHGEPGPPRWRLELLHARGGLEGAWIVQSGGQHGPHPVRVVAGLADPTAQEARRQRG
jgi:protein ImuA